MKYVALLRGINVGGNSLIKMSELKACFEALGFSDVSTYINSGNVIFSCDKTDQIKLEGMIETKLGEAFGFAPKTVVRSANDIQTVIDNLPKAWNESAQKCNVIFLKRAIDNPDIIADLSPKPGIESLEYRPGVLYWAANTSDLTKSSMVKLSKSALYQDMTVRNLNTTRKIASLLA